MQKRMHRSAAIMVVVLALFLVGQNVHAAWTDWLPWPFSSQVGPQVKTPSVGAQEMPPGGNTPPPQNTGTLPPPPPPPSGNFGNQPQMPPPPGGQGPLGAPPQGTPPPGNQPGQSNQPGQDNFKPPFPGDQGNMKPPFPGTDQQQFKQGDDQRFRMESEQSRKMIEEKMQQEDKARQQQQNGQMPFPGQGNTQRQFPGQGATQGQFPGGPEGQRPMMNQQNQQQQQPQIMDQGKQQFNPQNQGQQGQQQPQFNFDEQSQQKPQVFFDPQFAKQVAREVSDQTRELNRLLKAAGKLTGGEAVVAEIQGLLTKIEEFKTTLKSAQGEDLQSAIDDFHDLQIWDSLNGLRAKVELPKQLKEMDRSVTKIEKLVKQKSFQKLSAFGVDFAKVTADVASFREKINNVRTLLSGNDVEGAQEAMQEIFQDGHPGEIEGSLQQLRGMTDGLSRIRNKDIQTQVKEIFQPVIEAINGGDYRQANELMNELGGEMQRIFSQLYRLNAKSSLSDDLQKKLDAFDARIQQKLQQQQPDASQTPSTETAPAQ